MPQLMPLFWVVSFVLVVFVLGVVFVLFSSINFNSVLFLNMASADPYLLWLW